MIKINPDQILKDKLISFPQYLIMHYSSYTHLRIILNFCFTVNCIAKNWILSLRFNILYGFRLFINVVQTMMALYVVNIYFT